MAFKFNPFTGKLDIAGSAGGGSPTGAAGGDLAGTYPNPTVDGLQGRPVSNATPVNGQVLQYDGTNWVPGSIPSGGSGGGGVVYYLNFNTAADAPLTNIPQTPNATKELGLIGDVTATSYLSPILSTASYDFLASFATDVSVPSATAIPAGIWDFNIFVESTTTNSANQVYFKIEILKYDGVNAPTLLATSNDTYIYDPAEITQQVASVVMPQTTILATDRILVYLYGRAHQNNNRLTFHFGGNYPSHTHSTMPSVTGTGVVKVVNGVFQSPATTIVNADVSASAAIGVSKLDMSTNRILGRTTAGTGAVEEISVGTGLSLSAGTLTNTGISGSVGAVDNAVLRADVGTGIVQNSGIIIDDAVISFAVTGDAGTDVITATGHNFIANQGVMFPSLTGGSGLNTTTVYFVRDISGSTFKVSATSGGGAINFTTNITAGTVVAIQANVAISQNTAETNSALVLSPKGTGALVLGPKPDGTTVGGNARGNYAVDLQTQRTSNANVASAAYSLVAGYDCKATVTYAIALQRQNTASGDTSFCAGYFNTVSGFSSGILTGGFNQVTASYAAVVGGQSCQALATSAFTGGGEHNISNQNYAAILGGLRGLADRRGMQAHAAGRFSADGDAQRARFVMRNKTTTNSAVELFLDGSSTRLTIPSGKYLTGTINIAGINSTGSTAASYIRQFSIKNQALTTALVGTVNTIGTDLASGTSINITADDPNDALKVEVTGIAAETWRWVASVDVVEVQYGT